MKNFLRNILVVMFFGVQATVFAGQPAGQPGGQPGGQPAVFQNNINTGSQVSNKQQEQYDYTVNAFNAVQNMSSTLLNFFVEPVRMVVGCTAGTLGGLVAALTKLGLIGGTVVGLGHLGMKAGLYVFAKLAQSGAVKIAPSIG